MSRTRLVLHGLIALTFASSFSVALAQGPRPDAWNAANKTPPALLGQVFHYTPSPNRYGIPAFHALHVWAWRDNPNGMFADWNPRVSCAEHAAEAPAAARP